MKEIEVIAQRDVVAYIIRKKASPALTGFLTPPDSEMQLGLLVYEAGQTVRPHRHVDKSRQLRTTPEAIFVRKGLCVIELFNAADKRIVTRELHPGDLILILKGAHAFRMLKPTVLLEVKQGPYAGLGEKEFLT